MQRVQKLLSNHGYCSRRKAEYLIKAGRVKVNGKPITIGDKASENDKITVDNKPIQKEKRVYLMFNKPLGCVTALRDKRFKTVIDFIKFKERIFPIGRLDFNTSGLLLLTNDGDFANNIMHPRNEIKKTYLVKTNKAVKKSDLNKLEQGLLLKDGKTAPAKVKIINSKVLTLTIHEGKNRIVRRMMGKLGYPVMSLERVAIGNLRLKNLKPGESRILTEKDKEQIFS